jgi:endonuclease YncB( thermonuclease family)
VTAVAARVDKRKPRVYEVARIIDVHDADTIRVLVDVGFEIPMARPWIRLKGVRAQELAKPGGPEARQVTLTWIAEHAPDSFVQVTTFWTPGELKQIREKMSFIRFVGVVTARNGAELNQYLIDAGYINQGD